MSTNRQLAAIMFTDIVGYTKLMGENEEEALQLLRKNINLHKSIIKKYHGKWLKEMGDGTLASFRTISDAVYCTGALVKECKEAGISLRIGVHFGEITEERGDIFGDGVNVASRLEPMAQPGQILVSGPIHRNVKNKPGISSTYLGEKELKNVDEPVRVYQLELSTTDASEVTEKTGIRRKPVLFAIALAVAILLIYGLSSYFNIKPTEEKVELERSIAVLPFRDMSPEQDQEYLGDGVAEAIIDRLTRGSNLKVIGRTSSFSFKDKDTDLKTIGEMLGVGTILEGSVQKSGNQIRITAQLINAEDGFHIWSEQFDRRLEDIFLLQDELALLVTTKIQANVNKNKYKTAPSNVQINTEAYEFYLKGKHLLYNFDWRTFMNEGLFPKAENMFKEALNIDTEYALAHAGLADLYSMMVSRGIKFDSVKSINYVDLQNLNIRRAYELDPNSDYVNNIKGWIHFDTGEMDSAYIYFVNAIKLNPEDKNNYIALANFLKTRGLPYEAALLMEAAKEINPLDADLLINSANINRILGNPEKAIEVSEVVMFLEPDNYGPYSMIFISLIDLNKVDEAEASLEKTKEKFPDRGFKFHEGLLYAAKGETAKALAIRKNSSWYYDKLGMKEEYIRCILEEYKSASASERPFGYNYIWFTKKSRYPWLTEDPRTQKMLQDAKEKYEFNKKKYGNLDFLDI